MAQQQARGSFIWPNALTLVLGAWIFISPWVFPSATIGAWSWDAWIVGALVAILSIAAMAQVTQWEDWGNLLLGAWLFFSPWIVGYAGNVGAAWDSYIVGILVAAISIWGIVAARSLSTHSHA